MGSVMGRRAARNMRGLQALLGRHMRRGWLLSNLYLPPGVSGAAQQYGGLGVSHPPSLALVGWCSVVFTYNMLPLILGILCHLQRRGAVVTFDIGKAVPAGEKSPFEPHVGCFFILFPPSGRLY